MRHTLVSLLLALAAADAHAGPGEAADVPAPPRISVQFKDSPAYAAARDVELKTVVLRRTMKSVPKEWIEYAKVEVWMSNLELDVCALPELGDAANLPLESDDQFVLVWEGASPAPRRGVYTETPVAQALFSEQWLEAHGKPIVLLWWQGVAAEWSIREVLGNVPFIAVHAAENRFWLLRGADGKAGAPDGPAAPGYTLVRTMPRGNWFFHHRAAKAQRHKELSFGYVAMRKADGGPRMQFSRSRAGLLGGPKLSVQGDVLVTKVCPEIKEDKRFWLDGKVYVR